MRYDDLCFGTAAHKTRESRTSPTTEKGTYVAKKGDIRIRGMQQQLLFRINVQMTRQLDLRCADLRVQFPPIKRSKNFQMIIGCRDGKVLSSFFLGGIDFCLSFHLCRRRTTERERDFQRSEKTAKWLVSAAVASSSGAAPSPPHCLKRSLDPRS